MEVDFLLKYAMPLSHHPGNAFQLSHLRCSMDWSHPIVGSKTAIGFHLKHNAATLAHAVFTYTLGHLTCVAKYCKQSNLPSCAAKYTGVVPLSARLLTQLAWNSCIAFEIDIYLFAHLPRINLRHPPKALQTTFGSGQVNRCDSVLRPFRHVAMFRFNQPHDNGQVVKSSSCTPKEV